MTTSDSVASSKSILEGKFHNILTLGDTRVGKTCLIRKYEIYYKMCLK